MSDVMDIIGNLDVVEEITFPDEIVLKLYQDRLKERKQGYFLSYIKGQVEITCIAELTLQIKGKIMDIAPAYIMGVMMSMPSSLAIESAAKYVKDKYGFETKNVEGEIFPSITLTDEIIAGLMKEYPELAEMVRAHVESKVSVVSGRKLLNRGALEPARAIPINLEQSGIEINLTPPPDLDMFALTLAGNRPIWDPNKQISEGFAFSDWVSDHTWEELMKSPACVTRVGEATIMVTGRAIDVCNTMMDCMMSTGAFSDNIDNVGNHLAKKYGFRYPVDGTIRALTRSMLERDPSYSKEANDMMNEIAKQKITPFTSPLQPIQNRWEDGFVDEAIPKAIEAGYDRAIEIYNELRLAKLSGAERAVLLAEMQSITNSGVLLYALKRHHHDVE